MRVFVAEWFEGDATRRRRELKLVVEESRRGGRRTMASRELGGRKVARECEEGRSGSQIEPGALQHAGAIQPDTGALRTGDVGRSSTYSERSRRWRGGGRLWSGRCGGRYRHGGIVKAEVRNLLEGEITDCVVGCENRTGLIV